MRPMHPVLFELPGGIPVRAFGLMVALGFLVGAHLLWPRALAEHGADPARDPHRAAAVSFWILVGMLLGARLGYVGVELTRLAAGGAAASPVGARLVQAPWEALYLWKGGMVMYGGLIGAVVAGAWSARRQGLSLPSALDTGLACGFVGQAIGRVGCLMVGDDHGRVVPEAFERLPFPVTLRVPSAAWLQANPESLFPHELAGRVLWATQTWMSIGALAIGLCGFWLLPRRRYAGQVALTLGLVYGLGRFAIEVFRGDEVRGLWFGGALSTSQLLSIPLAVGCGALLFASRARREDLRRGEVRA
ncbi:Prolipoprotein diacylglyceryl transferase [Planctomycetes bacterium Pla86]|uniref:Prolipoprotein diacylglyceryl transferase n=3 Tax=Engelhardtia mirabilis TaxID=2528011 RepID=A0A518BMT3_9BACT|nr:Prolipoprotein diacylglyceryl transferase [Planctomycetes bacterium Pla133]QDV02593.1 Prolipoprotein diacylglyceryl transferase [Planctomycetes bacterium Pla86]